MPNFGQKTPIFSAFQQNAKNRHFLFGESPRIPGAIESFKIAALAPNRHIWKPWFCFVSVLCRPFPYRRGRSKVSTLTRLYGEWKIQYFQSHHNNPPWLLPKPVIKLWLQDGRSVASFAHGSRAKHFFSIGETGGLGYV